MSTQRRIQNSDLRLVRPVLLTHRAHQAQNEILADVLKLILVLYLNTSITSLIMASTGAGHLPPHPNSSPGHGNFMNINGVGMRPIPACSWR